MRHFLLFLLRHRGGDPLPAGGHLRDGAHVRYDGDGLRHHRRRRRRRQAQRRRLPTRRLPLLPPLPILRSRLAAVPTVVRAAVSAQVRLRLAAVAAVRHRHNPKPAPVAGSSGAVGCYGSDAAVDAATAGGSSSSAVYYGGGVVVVRRGVPADEAVLELRRGTDLKQKIKLERLFLPEK